MRAHYTSPTDKMLKSAARACREDDAEYREQVFREVVADIAAQTTANIIWTLWKMEGYGEKRIKRLIEHLHDMDELMEHPSRLHHRFDPLDCEREIKEKFGVDLHKEFPPKVEVKP